MYADRFPQIPESQWTMIPNGYDEEDFAAAEQKIPARRSPGDPVVLVHSGVLYPSERDPMPFFKALSEMRSAGQISPSRLKVVLRATGHDDYYRTPLRDLGINDIVSLEPPISHSAAVTEMLEADGLLIFQATNCNRQIPAKVYECLRARRPVFAMTDPAGDTATFLKAEGIRSIVPLDSKENIGRGLIQFLALLANGSNPVCPSVDRHSRKARTQELAALLNSVCKEKEQSITGGIDGFINATNHR